MRIKKIIALFLCISLMLSIVGCTNSNKENPKVSSGVKDTQGKDSVSTGVNKDKVDVLDFEGLISQYNLSEAQKIAEEKKFVDVEPMYNVPSDKQFVIDLNLSMENNKMLLPSHIEQSFQVYTDRECTEKLIVDIDYDAKTNKVTIKPDVLNWRMYPREGIDKEAVRTWGGLSNYYLVIDMNINSQEFTKLDKPTRMLFTIASEIDMPTVVVKSNTDGNMALSWKAIEGVSEYKIYYGTPYGLKELGKTSNTEYVLSNSEYSTVAMNTMLSDVCDYAVVAIKDGKESRLSNIIDGAEYVDTAVSKLANYEEYLYSSRNTNSIFDLPLTVDVEMVRLLENSKHLVKEYPILWDLRNPISTDYGTYKYNGKVLGTTFVLTYSSSDKLIEEQIAKFEQERGSQLPKSVATDVTDAIDIPNTPSSTDIAIDTEKETNITEVVKQQKETPKEEPKAEPKDEPKDEPKVETQVADNLELAIAIGMLNFESSIDLSAYPESGDSIYLKDVLQKVMVQYPLILGEGSIGFDYVTKTLYPEYSISKEVGIKKQQEIISKVKEIVQSEISSNMSITDKQKALHDWLINNVEYHNEILEAYNQGGNLNDIATTYADSFTSYGALLKGLGVCQSYAEAYKLLCDEAGVPCIVATGTMQTVPHAWNKVNINGNWYNVDVTNNDGDMIPYAVFNTSNLMTANDYVEDKAFAIDTEIKLLYTSDNKQDYYYLNNKFAETKEQLSKILEKEVIKGENFYIKISPDIDENTMKELLSSALGSQRSKIRFGKIFNILVVLYN